MRIIGINIINTTIKTKAFNRLPSATILKDTFELQNKKQVSFGKKKSKEKTDKNKIYKPLRKAGCGEKDTNSVLNNENRYNHLLTLMAKSKDFERELSLKEITAIALNEFDEEQTQQFISITGKNISVSRSLSQKEAVSFVKNKVDNEKLQRFIDLRESNDEGNSLLSRVLTPSEACFICNQNFDNIQAETYIRLKDINLNFSLIDFLEDKQNIERFLEIVADENPFSKRLTDEEAIQITMAKFDNAQIQRIIDLTMNATNNSRELDFEEAQIVVKNGFDNTQVQSFINTKEHISQLIERKNQNKEYYHFLSNAGIVLIVKNNFDKQRIQIFLELANSFFEHNISSIISDDEKYQRILSLTQKDKISTDKPFSIKDAGYIVVNNLTDVQTQIYRELINSQIRDYEAMNFVKDDRQATKYLQLTVSETNKFSRTLTANEAYISTIKDLTEKEIQELINIRDKNPNLKLDYISLLLEFIEYKDKKDIEELSLSEKRNLLKLLVKHNAALFNQNCSSSTYPLVPKTQEQYCKLLPKLTKAIGINTQPLSKGEIKEFNIRIQSLITSLQDKQNINDDLQAIYNFLPELKEKDLNSELKTLATIVKSPQFNELDEESKNILTIATLLKNISTNTEDSSFDAFYILQRFNFSEDIQLKIYELIKTSNWFEKISQADDITAKKIAQDIAFETRHSNTFELSKLLIEASLSTSDKQQDINTMRQFAEKIDLYLKKLQETQIFLPQTQIPKASKMRNCQILTANGVTNTVFYINNADNELSLYGFENGTTKTNWQGLVHGLATEQQLQIFTTFSLIDSEALLSSSYMNTREYKVFRKQGLILDINPNDIHAGYFKDFGSGFKKDIDKLKQNYLFPENPPNTIGGGNRSQYRTYIPNLIKQHLNYSDSDYLKIIKELQGCKSITDIQKKNKDFANALLELFETTKFGKRKYNRKYNEILISRPKVQGVFSYGQTYEEIPLFLRKYAQDNDLPIIMFG